MIANVKLRQEAIDIKNEIIEIRRHIHQNPETAYEEHETAKYIVEQLKKLCNITIQDGIGRTGVVGTLQGDNPNGPCILLRADMDALNLQANTGEEFMSKNKGKHHGCGHDGHVAMLLGCAKIVNSWKSKIKGSIKFCFQPAEEGGAGANAMIEDGVLQNVDECYGMHLFNNYEYPRAFVKSGYFNANSDRFDIKIKGTGSHAMTPQNSSDAVMIGCNLVNSLYTISSRSLDPNHHFTISIGQIEGGTAPNIIASECNIKGTTRTCSEEDRQIVIKRCREICNGFEILHNCKIELEYKLGYNAIYNDEAITNKFLQSGNKIIQFEENTFGLAGEDFSFFALKKPSTFFLLGSAPLGSIQDNGKTILKPHHSPYFTIDENALVLGTSVWIQLVEDLLTL